MQGVFFGHVFASQISLDLQLLLYYRHLLVLLSGLHLCLFNRVPRVFLILRQIIVEILHVFLQHQFSPFQPFLVQFGQFLKLVDFLPLVVDQHLKQQSFPLLTHKVMHWLVHLHPILYRIFSRLQETRLRLIILLLFPLLAQLIQLPYRYALLLDSLLPNSHILTSLFLLPLSLLFLLLLPEDLHG